MTPFLHHRFAGVLAAALLCLTGCAVAPVHNMQEFAARPVANSFETINRPPVKSEAIVLDLTLDQQVERVSCGAHVLASVINYWHPELAVDGSEMFAAEPPQNTEVGYSMAELVSLASRNGPQAFGVRLQEEQLKREVSSGRPVLVPLHVPYVFVQNITLFDPDFVPVGNLKNRFLNRLARMSVWTDMGLLDHYALVVGYDEEKFVLLDPLLGYRTISYGKLEKYRKEFNDAAIVFSGLPVTPTPGNPDATQAE